MTKSKAQKKRAKLARQALVAAKRARPTPKKSKPVRALNARPLFSKCAADYLKVLENPFNGGVACVPAKFNTPTLKQSCRVVGSFWTGTNGIGSITVAPRSCAYYDAWGNTGTAVQCAVTYTTATYAAGVSAIYSDAGATNTGPNSPYTYTTLPSNARFRTVAIGVRIRNITPLLNRGGQVVGVETPGHDPIVNWNFSAFVNNDCAGIGDVNGKWNSIVWHPVDEDELDFFGNTDLGTNGTPGVFNNQCLGFMISAPPSTPQQYEFQIYSVFEVVGRIIHGTSPSMSDVQGMSGVQNAHSTNESRRPQLGERNAFVQNQLWKAASSIGSTLLGVGVQQGASYINNRIAGFSGRNSMPRITGVDIEEVD